jgi:pimeloyl-ACP methyl ester carboxylesterase
MARVKVADVEIAYDDAGNGPAIVLSHGAIADRRMWTHQLRDLSSDHRVIAYDWRGYGESGDADGEVSRHRDLLGLMDALDLSDADLVGCSMGAGHSLEAALAGPGRVRSLTLIGAGLPGHLWPTEMLEEVQQRVHSSVPADRLAAYQSHTADRVDPRDVFAMAAAYARYMVAGPERDPAEVDPDVWQLALEMLRGVFEREWSGHQVVERQLAPPASARLAEVTAPTLVLNGRDDVRWIQDVAGLLVAGIPGARRLDIPDTAHQAPLERPDEVTAAIRRHLVR